MNPGDLRGTSGVLPWRSDSLNERIDNRSAGGRGRQRPTTDAALTINAVMVAYLRYAAGYYNAGGKTSEVA